MIHFIFILQPTTFFSHNLSEFYDRIVVSAKFSNEKKIIGIQFVVSKCWMFEFYGLINAIKNKICYLVWNTNFPIFIWRKHNNSSFLKFLTSSTLCCEILISIWYVRSEDLWWKEQFKISTIAPRFYQMS